jgi:hypothetical protein
VSSFSQDWLGYRAYNLAYYQITENSIHYRSIEQFDEKLGSVRIRSLAFPIDDNLDSAGQYFMQTYFSG